MKNVALFDADGTLYEGFSIFPLYDAFASDGFISDIENFRLQEVLGKYNSSEIDYKSFVIDTLQVAAKILKGRQLEAASRISELFFADETFDWFGYVKSAMSNISETGADKVLITAEPQFVAKSISAAIGMDGHYSSQFGIENDGNFAGNVLSALGSSQKGEIAKRMADSLDDSIAFGDSEGDIGMLEAVNMAICIKPTEELRSYVVNRSWTVVDDPDRPIQGLLFAQP